MIRVEIRVKPDLALKSKSVAELIQKASNYEASIWIENEGKKANAKSMLGILALGIADGSVITVIADGVDEELAINDLREFIGTNV